MKSHQFHLCLSLESSCKVEDSTWLSGCLIPRAYLPLFLNQRGKSGKDLQLGVMPSQRALGVKWNRESDIFGFKVKVKEKPLLAAVYCPWSVQCMTPWGSRVLSYYLLKLSCKACTVVDWNGTMWSLTNTWRTGNSGFVIFHDWKDFLLIAVVLLMGLEMLAVVNSTTSWRFASWLRCSHLSSLSQQIKSYSLYLCDAQGKGRPSEQDYYTSIGTNIPLPWSLSDLIRWPNES